MGNTKKKKKKKKKGLQCTNGSLRERVNWPNQKQIFNCPKIGVFNVMDTKCHLQNCLDRVKTKLVARNGPNRGKVYPTRPSLCMSGGKLLKLQ
jgi:hypothetical protein